MSTAKDRGWGDPYAADFESHLTTIKAGGIRFRCHIAVAPIFQYLLTELAKHYPLGKVADDWGWARRPIRGYETQWKTTRDFRYLSNHSWGLAGDLDSEHNPMTKNPAAAHEFRGAVIDPILRHFAGRLIWGGEYSGTRKDYMHFEYVGTPAQAHSDALLAKQLLRPAPATKPTRTLPAGNPPTWFHTGCAIGHNSEEVRAALRVLKDPNYPPTAVLSDRVAGLFGYVAATYGLPHAGGKSGLTRDVARAIADWRQPRAAA